MFEKLWNIISVAYGSRWKLKSEEKCYRRPKFDIVPPMQLMQFTYEHILLSSMYAIAMFVIQPIAIIPKLFLYFVAD